MASSPSLRSTLAWRSTVHPPHFTDNCWLTRSVIVLCFETQLRFDGAGEPLRRISEIDRLHRGCLDVHDAPRPLVERGDPLADACEQFVDARIRTTRRRGESDHEHSQQHGRRFAMTGAGVHTRCRMARIVADSPRRWDLEFGSWMFGTGTGFCERLDREVRWNCRVTLRPGFTPSEGRKRASDG